MYKIRPDNYFQSEIQPIAVHRTFPEVNETEHDHDFEELVIVERGSAMHILNGESHFIQTGDVFYIKKQDYHYYKNLGSLCLTNVLVRPEIRFKLIPSVESILKEMHGWFPSTYLHLGMRERVQFFSFMKELLPCLEGRNGREAMKREGLLLQMISLFDTKRALIEGRDKSQAIEKILERVRLEHCEEVDWLSLCHLYGISQRTLFRQVKDLTGHTPEQYLLLLRLRTARDFIKYSDLSVSDVALRSGFKNFSHFSRCYKAEYAISPREDRKKEG